MVGVICCENMHIYIELCCVVSEQVVDTMGWTETAPQAGHGDKVAPSVRVLRMHCLPQRGI